MSKIAMIGTHFDTMGGVSSVVSVYRIAGMFEKFNVVYLPSHCDGSRLQKTAIFLSAWFSFLLGLVTFRWQVVHVHVASRASFWRKSLFVLPAILFRCPVILHLHGAEFKQFFERECTDGQRAFIKLVFRRSHCVIVLSSSWRDWVSEHCPNWNIRVLFNPVLYRNDTAKPDASYAAQRILFLGRLGKRKGAYDLVDALAVLKGQGIKPELLMGGDGEVDEVRAHAQRQGVADQVRFLGWVRGADKQRLLDDATLYCLPSYNEGLPMGLLEAMEAGLPIVSTPIGGIPDAVTPGQEGALVAPGDVPALAQALHGLLSRPDVARQQGQAARAKVRRLFSHLAVEPQLAEVYAAALKGRP